MSVARSIELEKFVFNIEHVLHSIVVFDDEFSARVVSQSDNDRISLVDSVSVHLALEVSVDTESSAWEAYNVGQGGQQLKQVRVFLVVGGGIESEASMIAMFEAVDHSKAHRVAWPV